MPFDLPPWLTERSHPFESLAKGAAVGVQLGKAFADNIYRNQALYIKARQEQQEQDLKIRALDQRDSAFALKSQIARTKMTNDTADYNTLQEFIPMAGQAQTFDELNQIQLPALHNAQNYLKLSLMLDKTKTEKAMGEMNAELSTTQDWADPSVYGIMLKWAQKAPDITLTPAYDHLLGRHQAAVVAARTANRLEGEAESRAEARQSHAEYQRDVAERQQLLADSKVSVDDARITELNSRIATRERITTLREKIDTGKLEIQQLLADETVKYDDARIQKIERENAMSEREMLVREGNLALRKEELGQKGHRLSLRDQAMYRNDLAALNTEERRVLAKTLNKDESKRLATVYNLKRRALTEKYYSSEPKPGATHAPPGTAPSAPSDQSAPSEDFLPTMPKSKDALKKGTVYITPLGEAEWDGEKFIPQ